MTDDPLHIHLVDRHNRQLTFVYKFPLPDECPDGFNQIVTSDLFEFLEIIEDDQPVVGVFELWRENPHGDTHVIPEARSTGPKAQLPRQFWVELEELIEKYR